MRYLPSKIPQLSLKRKVQDLNPKIRQSKIFGELTLPLTMARNLTIDRKF